MDESVGVFLTCCALVGLVSAKWLRPPALIIILPVSFLGGLPFGFFVAVLAWLVVSATYVIGCVSLYFLSRIDLPRLGNQKAARAVQKSAD
jgi:hypothetical protein